MKSMQLQALSSSRNAIMTMITALPIRPRPHLHKVTLISVQKKQNLPHFHMPV